MNFFTRISAIVAVTASMTATAVSAGTVALFADVNIFTNYFGNAGNQTVLSNLLGGGTSVHVNSNPGYLSTQSNVTGYYNSLGGVSASSSTGSLSAASLSGIDLLFLDIGFNANNHTASDISLISNFISSGGDVGIQVESDSISGINSFLTAIGLSMQLTSPRVNGGYQAADTILSTALTAGVNSFEFAANNGITGGTAAISDGGSVLVAFQEISPSPVPVPAAFPLLLAALGGLGFVARRRKTA